MAHGDDYRDWRDREDERIRLADLATENSHLMREALRHGKIDEARRRAGVPPPEVGYEGRAEPERTDPPTVEEQFAKHKDALEAYLARVDEFLLPGELCRDWLRRVEPLDLGQPVLSLATIEGIRDEYWQAFHRHQPPLSAGSTRMRWEELVPRIGREIEWVEALFRRALDPW